MSCKVGYLGKSPSKTWQIAEEKTSFMPYHLERIP